VATDVRTEPLPRTRGRGLPSPLSLLGFALVAIVLVWLFVNLAKTPGDFFRDLLIGITLGAIYGLVALGYTLVYGILELINFAHGDVFMFGGTLVVVFGVQIFGLSGTEAGYVLWPVALATLVLVMVLCGALNATVEFFAYRPLRGAPRLAPLITAIGVSFVLEDVVLAWKGANYQTVPNILPHSQVFDISGVVYRWDKLIVVLVTIPVLVALTWLVQRTKQGKAMRATAQDRDAAAMMGINVNRTISFTFLIAGALAGAGGFVYVMYEQTIRFDQGFQLGLIAFTAAVLGGIGNLTGAVLGSLLIGLIQAFNEGLSWKTPGSDWTESIVFSILILILVFRPEGLLGERTPEGG